MEQLLSSLDVNDNQRVADKMIKFERVTVKRQRPLGQRSIMPFNMSDEWWQPSRGNRGPGSADCKSCGSFDRRKRSQHGDATSVDDTRRGSSYSFSSSSPSIATPPAKCWQSGCSSGGRVVAVTQLAEADLNDPKPDTAAERALHCDLAPV